MSQVPKDDPKHDILLYVSVSTLGVQVVIFLYFLFLWPSPRECMSRQLK